MFVVFRTYAWETTELASWANALILVNSVYIRMKPLVKMVTHILDPLPDLCFFSEQKRFYTFIQHIFALLVCLIHQGMVERYDITLVVLCDELP